MVELRGAVESGGLVSAAAALLMDFGFVVPDLPLGDTRSLLDWISDDPDPSRLRWSQDRILPTADRYEALGGPVVAEENQCCWLAVLRAPSAAATEVEFVCEFRGFDNDEFVVEFRSTRHRMALDEFLVRLLVREWVIGPGVRRLNAHEVGTALDSYVLLEAVRIEGVGGFSEVLAGVGWLGVGRGKAVSVSTRGDPRRVLPLDAGTNWEEYVEVDTGPFESREPPSVDKNPWADVIRRGTRAYRWVPFDSQAM